LNLSVPFYPRMHICLLDMSADGYRQNGGLGFPVATNARLGLRARRSSDFDLSILEACGYSTLEAHGIARQLEAVSVELGLRHGLSLTEAVGLRRSCGFGSGTYIRLACIRMLLSVNGRSVSRSDMVRWSGRGGASGVGISTFFDGGLCFDVGRVRDGSPQTSSEFTRVGFPAPTHLARSSMPAWPCGLLIPRGAGPVSLESEREFFRRVIPLDDNAVHSAVYHALFGVYASVLDRDYERFCRAIVAMQRTSWKSEEIGLHGNVVSDTIDQLLRLGCDAAGMSSLGPCVYFFSRNFENVYARVRTIEHDLLLAGVCANDGCELTSA
jgi:beta-ribofuranosylaminobenzene 5'-phosphate synthase